MTLTIRAAMQRLRQTGRDAWFLSWPPDLFALTSTILRASDAYRLIVSVPTDKTWPPSRDWDSDVRSTARTWLVALGKVLPPSNRFADFELSSGTTSEKLRGWFDQVLDKGDIDVLELGDPKHWDCLVAVVSLHAIADEAGAYLANEATWGNADGSPAPQVEVLLRYRTMLGEHGSLARIPTTTCRVVPKAVAPRSGVTVRGLSANLAMLNPLVDVQWHRLSLSTETLSPTNQGANILLLPWPERVHAADFEPVDDPAGRPGMNPERYGYFRFRPSERLEGAELAEALGNMFEAAGRDGERADIVILPEAALDEQGAEIAREVARDQRVKLLVTGVQQAGKGNEHDDNVVQFSWYPHADATGTLACKAEQSKHHRWYLDGAQVAQYQLGSVLGRRRVWWERISIQRRRQMVLETGAGFGSMLITPLICEDLARQEPIGDLLRTLGPSLVFALLLDGPQLKSRWPGHYACVLADDPGSAVLTLTSLGMVQRSHADGHPLSRIVALWKDGRGTFREIEIAPEARGVLLRVELAPERTTLADGREHEHGANVLRLAQVIQVHPTRAKLIPQQPPRSTSSPPADLRVPT
jgi:hypothetical protein